MTLVRSAAMQAVQLLSRAPAARELHYQRIFRPDLIHQGGDLLSCGFAKHVVGYGCGHDWSLSRELRPDHAVPETAGSRYLSKRSFVLATCVLPRRNLRWQTVPSLTTLQDLRIDHVLRGATAEDIDHLALRSARGD